MKAHKNKRRQFYIPKVVHCIALWLILTSIFSLCYLKMNMALQNIIILAPLSGAIIPIGGKVGKDIIRDIINGEPNTANKRKD